jgi:hypothetical protein
MSEKVELDGDGVPLEAEGFSEKERAANRPGETEKADSETKQADSETKQAKDETEQAESETKQAESETKRGDSETKKRDWVEEAYKCFIKDAGDIDPTDPVKAVEAYFRKNATDELKARCKAEGKDAKGCWKFIEAVARKALHGSSGHIDPAVVYAIAMHWFEDVPKDWDAPAKVPARQAKPKAAKKTKPKKPAETPSEIRKEKERMAKAKAKAKAKKPKQQQGFFFEMLETPEQESEVKDV